MSPRAVASAGPGHGLLARGGVVLGARVRPHADAVALAALAPAVFLLGNRVFSSPFLVLLVAVWALVAALPIREQPGLGVAIAGATLANAPVHPYTLPAAWQLASLAMFGLAIGLTAWLVVRAAQPHAEAVPT